MHGLNCRTPVASSILVLALLTFPASAQEKTGVMTITLNYQATTSQMIPDFDGMWEHKTEIDQRTVMTCPVKNDGVDPRSHLDGASQAQLDADAAIGRGTAADQKTMQDEGTLDQMQALEKLMKDCKARGGSDEACAMQVMQAMQSDPSFVERGGRTGEKSKEAQKRVGNVDGRFEIWFSENCKGEMTANNRVTKRKGSVVKEVETVVGRRPLSDADANIVVETDLTKGSTRTWIVSPSAQGFPRTAPFDTKNVEALQALPVGNVIAGPTPGGIKSGTLRKPMPGGEYKVEWIFKPN